MKWLLSVLFVGTTAFAAEPLYFPQDVQGYFIEGFGQYQKLTIKPGTMSNCKSSGSGGFMNYSCELNDAQIQIEVDGKTHSVPLKTLQAYENGGSPTTPGSYSYYMAGRLSITLPDGSPFEADVAMNLARQAATPDRLSGSMNIHTIGINGGVIATWPPDLE